MVRSRSSIGAAVVLAGLVLAACGSDDGDDAAGSPTTAEASSSTTSSDASSSTTAPAQPTSMEEWEELWATQRQAVVDRIVEAGGVSTDGMTASGPGGLTVDLSECPDAWSETEGLTDTEIKIGQTLPQSGPAADYGNVGRAETVIYEYYNEAGAFEDSEGKVRKVNYIIKDDAYDPARTIPLVDELLDSEHVFAIATLGTPPSLKTYDKFDQRCIPHPFVLTGHPAFADPVNHPWSTAHQLSYTTEAVLWGAFVDQRFDELAGDDGKVKVASLVSNNDFGKAYDVGFQAYLETSEHADDIEYVSQTHEPTAPTVTDAMTTLAAEDPDVFIAMVFSSYCTQALTEAAQNGMHESVAYLFAPSVCPGNTYVKADAVGGDGTAADGWWQVNPGTKDINDPNQFDDPFIAWVRDQLSASGIDPASSGTLGSGVYFGWSWVQALRIAGELPGGLTRSNLMLASHSIDMTHPFHLPGIGFNVNGVEDAYPSEGGVFQRWSAAEQVWEIQGETIDLSGQSKNCVYDPATGLCKS
ncbi:MAG: ABC transporter substrate-binding protein [Acidimicrobiia bacterium]|nr:ABC transporter substrate-binding protein [Acidimicrobiia bacterium]